MKILIIGGTRFVGLAMTHEALSRGHDVTVFHRSSNIPAGTENATHVQGDRLVDLAQLAGSQWDVVIDVCAYRPNEVAIVAEALGTVTQKYVLVSTVSVYDEAIAHRSDEDGPLTSTAEVSDLDVATVPVMDHYGALKVLCEQAATQGFANLLIIRPTYVVGPNDYTHRFTAWVDRISRGGVVDVPEPQSASLQLIDVRDLASFTMDAIDQGLTGPFHVASPSGGLAFSEVMRTIAVAMGESAASLNWISVEEARESGQAFPLWSEGEDTGILALDTSRALAAGLVVRDLAVTISDISAELGANQS